MRRTVFTGFLHGWDGVTIPTWILWARLPVQLSLINYEQIKDNA